MIESTVAAAATASYRWRGVQLDWQTQLYTVTRRMLLSCLLFLTEHLRKPYFHTLCHVDNPLRS